jgi:hypothetical protein
MQQPVLTLPTLDVSACSSSPYDARGRICLQQSLLLPVVSSTAVCAVSSLQDYVQKLELLILENSKCYDKLLSKQVLRYLMS